jgi:hypothetical protein
MKRLIPAMISLLIVGCVKKYKFTTKVCGGQFYIEDFNVNPAGVNEAYLTDSINFRIYVGKYDNEHENFSFVCNGDSIKIMKLVMPDTGMKMKILDSLKFSFSDLAKKRMSDSEPLFEFK